MISAVASRFSGGFRGCFVVSVAICDTNAAAHGLGEEEMVVLGFDSQILEYRVGPESFHKILLILAQSIGARLKAAIPNCLFDHV